MRRSRMTLATAGRTAAAPVWLRAAALAALALAASAQDLRVDECATGIHTCSPSGSLCTDTDESFTCRCLTGFAGDGSTCVRCAPIADSAAVSCSPAAPSLSTAVACRDGYYRVSHAAVDAPDTCDPVPPAPAPLPSPEPEHAQRKGVRAPAFVLLLMMLMAAGIVGKHHHPLRHHCSTPSDISDGCVRFQCCCPWCSSHAAPSSVLMPCLRRPQPTGGSSRRWLAGRSYYTVRLVKCI